MKLIIGSKNPTKIRACKAVFPAYTIEGMKIPSGVSPQPSTDEETRCGAINRAKQALELGDADVGVGLEGGIQILSNQLYLCNWGALATYSGKIFTASGARITLPPEFLQDLEQGKELGEIMEDYTKKEDIRSNEGAIGVFTGERVDRSDMFTHVVQLLRGQWEYWSN